MEEKLNAAKRRTKDKREEWNASTHRHYLQCNKYNDGCSVTDMEYNMLDVSWKSCEQAIEIERERARE